MPTAITPPVASGYLDLENSSNADNIFSLASPSSNFNDQAILIEADDIYPLLEKRVLKDFKNFLNAYKATWGAFPYPSTFSNPNKAITAYVGNVGALAGFLPVADTGVTTTWNTTMAPVPTITTPPGNVVVPTACTFRTSNTRIRCDVTISAYNSSNPPTISIQGVVDNIGTGFYDGLVVTNVNDIQITTRSGAATVTTASRALTHSLDGSAKGFINFSGTLANTGVVRIEFRRAPPHTNWVLLATSHYLLTNNWHHLISYQVASTFLPGGIQTCGVSCLKINRLDVTPTTTQDNIHGLLISAGRKLAVTNIVSNPAQSRPGAALADYFDSASNISSGLVFEKIEHPMATFNDQIEIVE